VAGRESRRKAEGAPPRAEGQPGSPGPAEGERQPPAAEFRLGRIKATVWANFSESHGPWYSVVVTRTYKDGNGNFKAAGSFGRDDLLVVGEVTRLAYHWIMRQQGSGARIPEGEDGGEDTPF